MENTTLPEIKYVKPPARGPSPLEEEVKSEKKEEIIKYAAITSLYETEALKTALSHEGIVQSSQFLEGVEALKKYQKAAAYELAKERWPGKTEEELGRVVRATFGEKLEYERMREEREERVHPKKYKSVRAQERG